jgi:hypothetical protein
MLEVPLAKNTHNSPSSPTLLKKQNSLGDFSHRKSLTPDQTHQKMVHFKNALPILMLSPKGGERTHPTTLNSASFKPLLTNSRS